MATFFNKGRAAKANNPVYRTGKQLLVVPNDFTIALAGAAVGDIFVLAEGLSLAATIQELRIRDALGTNAGAIDNDFGFYKKDNDGNLLVVDKDILIDGVSFASAQGAGDLLRANTGLVRTNNIGDLLSKNIDQEFNGGLVLAMTMNAAITVADFDFKIDVVIEEANSD